MPGPLPPSPAPGRRAVAVLGVDSPIGLTVVRELGERGVPLVLQGRSVGAIGRYSRYCDHFLSTDRPLAEWLPGLVAEHRVAAVLACSESHLLQLSRLKDDLGDCAVLCPDRDRLDIVLDKRRTLEIAARLGFSVPPSWAPARGDDFARRASGLAYPVAIKWPDPNRVAQRLAAHGLGLEKVEYARSAEELLRVLRRYDPLGEWPLVQGWCAGQGLGQMLHMHRGAATLRFQHRRLREWPPTGGVSSFCEAVDLGEHRPQMAMSERLLQAIGWEGAAMVEYRHDPATGTYWLMEINGRFWGSIPLAHHAGAHFAWETYRYGLGLADEVPPAPRRRKARYVIPDLKHLAAIVRDRGLPLRRRLGFGVRFLADFVDPRVRYYVWSVRDPMPLVGDMLGILRRAVRR